MTSDATSAPMDKAAAPSLFLRNATGLVKGWSGFDAFVYAFMSVNLVCLGMFYSLAIFAYVPDGSAIASIIVTAIGMTFISVSWLVMTVMMLVMLVLLGPRHPRVIYEYESLDATRNMVAVFALVMFILCFTPVPIQLQDLVGGR